MDRQELEEKVNYLLIDELEIEVDKIAPDARLKEDLGIDSLDYVDIVVMVNKAFGFKIQNGDLVDVKTLSQFYDYIASKVA